MPVIQIPPSFWEREAGIFAGVVAPHLLDIIREGTRAEAASLPGDLDWNLVNTQAMQRARTMIIKLEEEIIGGTRKAVIGWIEEGAPLSDLVERLETDLMLSDVRAASIATTEVTRAYTEGNLIAWRASDDVAKKHWETAADELVCPYCGPLDGEEVDLDKTFTPRHRDTGETLEPVDGPPAHVKCRCYIRPVIRRRG